MESPIPVHWLRGWFQTVMGMEFWTVVNSYPGPPSTAMRMGYPIPVLWHKGSSSIVTPTVSSTPARSQRVPNRTAI